MMVSPMAKTSVVKLSEAPLVKTSTGGSGGGCLIAFGLPFVAAGSFLVWRVYAHYEELGFSGPTMPRPFLYILASVFVAAGLVPWARGFSLMIANARMERTMRARPDEPWWGDHRWKPAGAREHPFLGAVVNLFFFAFVAAFLAPFHWWMSVDPWIPGYFILGLFDLIFLGIAAGWIYALARALKYGAAWIRYDRFPFFLGETLHVRVGCRRSLDRFDTLTVTVRHVRVRKDPRGNSTEPVAYQHWAETLTFDPRGLADPTELPVSLALPTGDLGTWLSEEPPRYWEIETKGEAPGIDFKSRFLLPIYARSGS
jgi:hypothetical protein